MKKYFSRLALIFFFITIATSAEAATFSVHPEREDIRIGETINFSVVIDTQGESINSLAGEVRLPENFQNFKINDGNSIVNFWVEHPVYNKNTVRFAGIIPGGYTGGNGLIFSVRGEASEVGLGTISFSQLEALLNDGLGTKTKVTGPSKKISVTTGELRESVVLNDSTPPESFVPVLGQDIGLFNGQYFIAFATSDKQSGLSSYEVAEEKWFRRFSYDKLSWFRAESPYLLSDQLLESNIYVRAKDLEGNIKVAYLSPRNPPLSYNYSFVFAILILLTLLGYFFLRRRQQSVLAKRK